MCYDSIGRTLLAHYRHILPIMNLFKQSRVNIGDRIHYGQRKQNVLGDLIDQTLELLE